MLKSIEYTKSYLMKEYNLLNYNDEAIRRTTVYPMARVTPLIINGYPVMQFAYEGVLPLDDKDDTAYLNKVRDYYYLSTFDSYDYSKMDLPIFDKATIIFVHYFSYKQLSDLDNRNTKFIQDAIRLTGVVKDDTWNNVWNLNMGFYDKERDHVQVYVAPTKHLGDFIDYLMKNHETLKQPLSDTHKLEDYENKFIALQEKRLKNKELTKKDNDFETINQIGSSKGTLFKESTDYDVFY